MRHQNGLARAAASQDEEPKQAQELPPGTGTALPPHVYGYIRETSLIHQIALSVMTTAAFLLELVPLELQREIVDNLVKKREFQTIIWLCAVYAGVVALQGGVKFLVNVYRGWVGERAVQDLRNRIRFVMETPHDEEAVPEALGKTEEATPVANGGAASGVQVSMIVSEVEPVGGFVGEAVSEPLLQIGVMVSTFAYMAHIEPWMALAAGTLFLPQFVFVPLMQRLINRITHARIRLLRAVSVSVVEAEEAGGQHNHADEARIGQVFRYNMVIYWLRFGMNFLMNFCNHLQVVAALLLGGWFVLHDQLALGGVVAFISGLSKLKDPWDELVDFFRNFAVTQVKYKLLADTYNGLTLREGSQAAAPPQPRQGG